MSSEPNVHTHCLKEDLLRENLRLEKTCYRRIQDVDLRNRLKETTRIWQTRRSLSLRVCRRRWCASLALFHFPNRETSRVHLFNKLSGNKNMKLILSLSADFPLFAFTQRPNKSSRSPPRTVCRPRLHTWRMILASRSFRVQ